MTTFLLNFIFVVDLVHANDHFSIASYVKSGYLWQTAMHVISLFRASIERIHEASRVI